MSEATIPANPTDQIATTTATRGDIASHEGDATIPAVAPWRKDLELATEESPWREGTMSHEVWLQDRREASDRLAAYIERLEADLNTVKDAYDNQHRAYTLLRETSEQLLAERDALLAEHEAWRTWMEAENAVSRIPSDEEWLELAHLEEAHRAAHNNAERVIRGE